MAFQKLGDSLLKSSAAAGHKMHHQGDHSKNQQNVDQKAGDVEQEETASPHKYQDDRQEQKHWLAYFQEMSAAALAYAHESRNH